MRGRRRRTGIVSFRCLQKEERRGEHTDRTPQVKALIVKQQATQTQPYPPSGGESRTSSKESSWVSALLDTS
jgi:hypothetical protein